MTLTQKDLKQIVKALEPKFKQIDKRFEQVDKRFEQVDERFNQVDKQFKDLSLDISSQLTKLATKEELRTEISRLDDRLDESAERFNEFLGEQTMFNSQVTQHFNHIRDDFKKQEKLTNMILQRIGSISTKVDNHDKRITILESK